MEYEKPKKYGKILVKNGTYTDKNGNTKNRYHEIGLVFATEDMQRISVKFHNTQNGEGQWAYIFKDEEKDFGEKVNLDEIKGVF